MNTIQWSDRAMPSHKFKVKQSVEFLGSYSRPKPLGRFQIVRVMPTEHGILQYRVTSLTDGHERVVTESDLV
jgi:hypothetical protein